MIKFLKSLFLTPVTFGLLTANIVLFGLAYFFPILHVPAIGLVAAIGAGVVLDIVLLYAVNRGIMARRQAPEKFSNGDENEVYIFVANFYNFPITAEIYDELPVQFQLRDLRFNLQLPSGGNRDILYKLRPTKRGEYKFGRLNVLVRSPLQLVRRRFYFAGDQMLPCYPSYLQMRKYYLYAASNRLHELGVKRVRRIGQSMEFEQIRDYVQGDDFRTINWKATARRRDLMVNQFIEERSQPVYCIIDKGRMMKMPFEGLSLLDYSINASLVLTNIAIYKQDRAGLITFSERIGTLLKASRTPTQMHKITETLYRQKTRYLDSNFETLYANIRKKVSQRSLLLLFTNFDSISSLHRQLPYLRRLNRDHMLVVIFFQNTELKELTLAEAHSTEEIYLKTVAEKFDYDKRQIVRELQKYRIQSILTSPAQLTVNTLNKYLELKARGMI